VNVKKFQPFLEYKIDKPIYHTTTSSYPEFSFNYDSVNSNLDDEQIVNIVDKLFVDFQKNLDPVKIQNDAHYKFGDNLYRLLELDSFFKALIIKNRIDGKESAIKYFKAYIDDLPRIFDKIDQDFSKSDVKDKFKKVKELKKRTKHNTKLSKKIFKSEMDALAIELIKMTEYVKDSGMRVLVTCDGRDSAGKGSFIKLVEGITNEKIVDHEWFGIPTQYDQEHWFDRYEDVLPPKGHLRFFDRSYYNRAVNDPVNGFCTEKQYKKFIDDVVPWEEKQIDEGLTLIKFWFSIEKETQEHRFALRQASPTKWWKFSPSDAKAVDRYDRFTFYKEQMFAKTSTDDAPWVVVDMNDKKLGQLNGIRYILSTIPYPDKNEDIIKPYRSKVYKI